MNGTNDEKVFINTSRYCTKQGCGANLACKDLCAFRT